MQGRDQADGTPSAFVHVGLLVLDTTWGWALALVMTARAPVTDDSPGVRLAVLPVDVGPQGAASAGQTLQEPLRRGLESNRYELVEGFTAARLAKCDTPACRNRTASTRGVTHWLAVRVTSNDRTHDVSLRLHTVGEEDPVMEASERCVICGRSELGDLIGAQAVVVRDWLEQRDAAVARIEVVAAPVGARVALDGRSVGRAPLQLQVEPGRHRIEVSARRHRSQRRVVTVGRGVTEHVAVELPENRDLRLWPWGAGLLASGVPSLTAGAVLWALDGRHYGPRCGANDPDNFDVDGDCRYVHDTFGAGVGLTVAGAAATLVGVTLISVDLLRGGSHRRIRAAVSASGVVLHGRF